MKFRFKKLIPIVVALSLVFSLTSPASAYDANWQDADGGIFNPPSEIFNPDHAGFGSTGQTLYNKVDLRNGKTMEIEDNTPLHDFEGNVIGTAKGSGIGYYDGTRDGGLVAGSLAQMRIGNSTVWATYAWSVNVYEGGRQSGWVDTASLGNSSDSSVQGEILEVLEDTHEARIAIFESELAQANYQAYNVVDVALPSYMEEYFLDPGRESYKTAGKAKYYYTRDGLLTVSMNIPETGSQRYGVGNNIIPAGDVFYRDMNVDLVNVPIYAPESYVAESHTLRLVWGYFEAPNGSEVYSWTNERSLEAAESPDPVPLPEPIPVPVPSTPVTVFANSNFGGASLGLDEGAVTFSVLKASSVGNDNISSIEIADGYTVTACQHGGMRGTCKVYTESTAILTGLNNTISSLEVTQGTSTPVTVFANLGFGGASLGLDEGIHDISVLRASAVGNDTISSIQIADGYTVTACQHGGMRGTCNAYTSSMSILTGFDNTISSLEVTRD